MLVTIAGGMFARLFRPMFAMITPSWNLYPLGVLFGLGFDTTTEMSLLGLSAADDSRGQPLWSVLVFSALFTAGMAVVDGAFWQTIGEINDHLTGKIAKIPRYQAVSRHSLIA